MQMDLHALTHLPISHKKISFPEKRSYIKIIIFFNLSGRKYCSNFQSGTKRTETSMFIVLQKRWQARSMYAHTHTAKFKLRLSLNGWLGPTLQTAVTYRVSATMPGALAITGFHISYWKPFVNRNMKANKLARSLTRSSKTYRSNSPPPSPCSAEKQHAQSTARLFCSKTSLKRPAFSLLRVCLFILWQVFISACTCKCPHRHGYCRRSFKF